MAQTQTQFDMIVATDARKLAQKISDAVADGWLMHGPWQPVGAAYIQMMVKPVEAAPEKLDELEMRIARLEQAMGHVIGQLQQMGSGVARPTLVLPQNLKGGMS